MTSGLFCFSGISIKLSRKILKPDKVYINFNGKSLIANAWGGCFGTSKTFKEFSMGADPITGWIEFKKGGLGFQWRWRL